MALYTLKAVNKLIELYNKATNGNYFIYQIEGSLLDNYIITAENCKTAIIGEYYLNEWSSAYKIRFYSKTPLKYIKVIDLLENGQEEQANKLFFQ